MSEEVAQQAQEERVEQEEQEAPASAEVERPRYGLSTWLALLILASLPVVFASGFTSYEKLKHLVLLGGSGLTLVVWAIEVIRAGKLKLLSWVMASMLLPLMLYMGLAPLWSPQPMVGLVAAAQLLAPMMLAWVLLAPSKDRLRFADFSAAVAVGAGLAGLAGLLDLAGLEIFTVVWDPPGPTASFDARAFGASYYGLALPLVIGAAVVTRGKMRLLAAASLLLGGLHFALLFPSMLAALAGGGALLATLVVVVLRGKPAAAKLVPIYVAFGVLGFGVSALPFVMEAPRASSDATSLPLLIADKGLSREMRKDKDVRNALFDTGRMESLDDARARDYTRQVGQILIDDQPLLGHGAGAWWLLQSREVKGDHAFIKGLFHVYAAFRSPQQGWIKVMVEYGALGLGLLLLWLLGALIVLFRSAGLDREDGARTVEIWSLSAALSAGLLLFLFAQAIELAASSALLFAVAAMATGSGRDDEVSTLEQAGLTRGLALLVGALGLGAIALASVDGVSTYWRSVGDQFMLRTYYARAIEHYNKAHEAFPYRGEVLYNKQLAAMRTSQSQKYRDELDRALELRPHDARLLYVLIQAEMAERRWASAATAAKRAIAANPNYIPAYKGYAASLEARGQFEESAAQLEAALALEPPEVALPGIYTALGKLYGRTLKQPAKGAKYYLEAIKYISNQHEAQLLKKKADAMIKQGEIQRLQREGKPVPPELLKGEDHGHDHGSMIPGMPRRPKSPPQKLGPRKENVPRDNPSKDGAGQDGKDEHGH